MLKYLFFICAAAVTNGINKISYLLTFSYMYGDNMGYRVVFLSVQL